MFTAVKMFTDVSTLVNVHSCAHCEGPSHDTFVIGFQLGPIFGYFHRQIAICWVVAAWICHRLEPYLCNHHRWFVRQASSRDCDCKKKICKFFSFSLILKPGYCLFDSNARIMICFVVILNDFLFRLLQWSVAAYEANFGFTITLNVKSMVIGSGIGNYIAFDQCTCTL